MNFSGFSAYTYANIYPQWGSGVTQTMETNPEPDEQQSYSTTEQPTVQNPVDGKSRLNMLYLLIGAVVLVVIFGAGKR